MRTFTQITKPSKDPISLDEAKCFVKAGDEEDLVISSFITTATNLIEQYLNASLITQTWRMTDDDIFCQADLAHGRVNSIDSVKVFDENNNETLLDTDMYRLNSDQSIIYMTDQLSHPSNLRREGAVEVQYQAGYGDNVDDVPQAIRTAILIEVGVMYNCRESYTGLTSPTQAMLTPYCNFYHGK